jgi:hypothetical protein
VANQTLTISMNGSSVDGPGDAELFLYPPGTTDVNTDPYADFSNKIGSNEFIQGKAPVGGFWYIDVYAFSGTVNYNVTVTLSAPGSVSEQTFNLRGADQSRDRQEKRSGNE